MAIMTVEADSTTFRFGTQSLKCTTGTTGDNAIYPSTAISVTPGEYRAFSIYVKTQAAITGGSLYLRIAQAGLLTPVLAESDPVTDSSTLADVVDGFGRISLIFLVPDGVFSIRPFLQYSGSTGSQVFWLDGVKLETGDTASEWQQNLVSAQVVHDQQGSIIDASAGGIFRLRGSTGGARDTVSLGTHGLLLGGDVNIAAQTTGVVDIDGDLTVTGGDLILNTDVRLSRPAAKTLKLGDASLGALTAVDFQGSLFRGFSGTSFPASPATNDRFYRTDLGEEFKYDGANWRCTVNHQTPMPMVRAVMPISATVAAQHLMDAPLLDGGSDIWLVSLNMGFQVASGGTALGASHKWVVTVNKGVAGAGTETTISTLSIASGSSAVWRGVADTIGALMNGGTTHSIILATATKTGTPGNLYTSITITWNHVAT